MNNGHARVDGKVALVTGAASGIGRATAELLAREGAKVAVVDLDEIGARATANAIASKGGAVIAHALDVTSEPGWAETIERVQDELGPLEISVHSAGISAATPLTETTLEQWRHVLAVNLDGVFLATRSAVAAMRGSPGGSIINVASASGVKASPGASAYCASKAAVIHFSKAVALECTQNDDPIRVNCVVPGGVKTAMWRSMPGWDEMENSEVWNQPTDAIPGKRFAQPEEIAEAIAFLASAQSSFVTGAALTIDGGYTA